MMKDGFSEAYGRKIKSVDELAELIGARPRKKVVVMCHGTFDLVHPGHLRHLHYAKSKGDILIASLTGDAHITKAAHRPFVPQELRAINLAALEMVDFVVIDKNPTPLQNLAKIQPDFFAKGYEYQAGGMHPKTREEHDVITGYGGEILFTPGDVVYSSSAIIETGPPNLAVEKLMLLMQAEGIDFNRLRSALDKCQGIKVHVVGDTIVDSLTYTSMIGGMTKTPTPSVRYESRADFVGGAGIVCEHLRAAGAEVSFSTVLGDDKLKDYVLDHLGKAGVKTDAIVDRTRPTTHKNAVVCGGYRLLKIDTLDNRSISDSIAEKMAAQVRASGAKAVVFSDFRHGIFNRRTIPMLTSAIPPNTFRVADSQVASRWGNILEFKGFDLITPNEREARFATADQDTGVRPLAGRLHEESGCRLVMLKLGERGIITCRNSEDDDAVKGEPRSFFVVDSFAQGVVDAVGAGDALLAYSTLAMVADGSEVVASILGCMAAGIECEKDGNIPISKADVLGKIDAVEKLARLH
jgi:rfaE bifunctional protein kinase chain/domain/rfaE bifunctional protein nucleotidyltransferase chain/domain